MSKGCGRYRRNILQHYTSINRAGEQNGINYEINKKQHRKPSEFVGVLCDNFFC